jgi:hypothetical protein
VEPAVAGRLADLGFTHVQAVGKGGGSDGAGRTAPDGLATLGLRH